MLKYIKVWYPSISTLKTFSLTKSVIGKITEAIIEPSETYPDDSKTIAKNPAVIRDRKSVV